MAHQIFLEVRDNFIDSRFMSVIDRSEYDGAVISPVFRIRVPSSNTAVVVPFIVSGESIYTSISTQYDVDDLVALPDGLYEFTYTVGTGEDLISNTVYYFRTFNLESSIRSTLSKLLVADCGFTLIDDCGNTSLNKQQNNYLELLYLLEAIKGNSTTNENYQKALELYQYAKTHFENYSLSYNKCLNC